MSTSILDGLLSQLQGAPVEQIAQQLGTDPATAHSAIATALPMIVGALGHQAQQPGGAEALSQALQGQQAGGAGALNLGGLLGSVLGSLTGGQSAQSQSDGSATGTTGGLGGLLSAVLGRGGAAQTPQTDASGILGNIFGDAQAHAQNGLGQASGLGTEKAGQLLAILGPIVMTQLANHAQTNHLDAGGLSAALGQERDNVQSQGGLAGSLLSAVLSRI